MKKLSLLLLLLSVVCVNAQNKMTVEQLKEKTDSIIVEANLLYKYEKAIWTSIDLANANEEVKINFKNYLVYQEGDSMITVILNKDNQCIYDIAYFAEFPYPIRKTLGTRSLSAKEKNLLNVKQKIFDGIVEEKVEIPSFKDFDSGTQLIPFGNEYKFYILSGTVLKNTIPFGNDYLFIADKKGVLKSWKKFHKGLMALKTVESDGQSWTETLHSHKIEPFISATDICTFRLYGSLCGQTSFQVYSPGLGVYFKYKLAENEIEIVDK